MQNNAKPAAPAEPFVRRHRPFFVTLFVLIPTLTLPVLLIYTMLKSDKLQTWHTLHVVYENSQGLKRGNPVSMSGIAIGHVRHVDLVREGEVQVSFVVNSRYKHLVRKDTRARLKQRGFVGDWEIELAGGTSRFDETAENDTLRSERMPTIDDMIELATSIIDTSITPLLTATLSILQGIEAGEGTVGQLLKNDTLFGQVNRIVADAARITSDVRRVSATAPAMVNDVRGIIGGVEGTLGRADTLLLTVTDAAKTGTVLMDTLMTLMGTVNDIVVDVGQILNSVKTMSGDMPEMMDRLQGDLNDIMEMLRSLQEGRLFRMIGGVPPRNPHLVEIP